MRWFSAVYQTADANTWVAGPVTPVSDASGHPQPLPKLLFAFCPPPPQTSLAAPPKPPPIPDTCSFLPFYSPFFIYLFPFYSNTPYESNSKRLGFLAPSSIIWNKRCFQPPRSSKFKSALLKIHLIYSSYFVSCKYSSFWNILVLMHLSCLSYFIHVLNISSHSAPAVF